MEEQPLNDLQTNSFAGPYRVDAAPKSLVRFALGSSATISTLLCIPDGIGILPNVSDPLTWILRVIGLWLSAYILWTAGFLAMMFFMRLIGGPIRIYDNGVKLWRFGKLIPFNSIKALTCEAQPFFARAFFLPPDVYRLMLYEEKTGLRGNKILAPHAIPSFQFSSKDFASILVYVSRKCFDLTPSGFSTTVVQAEQRPVLKASYERGRKLRVVMSAVILLSLVSFLGKQAARNYVFNLASREFRQEDYAKAARNYEAATRIDPRYPYAWDRLARCESRQGKLAEAEKHWRQALWYKPDFVEAKIGLSLIAMVHKDYKQAEELLQSSRRLSPSNIPAFINLANLYLQTSRPHDAYVILHRLLELDPTNPRAHALLAQTYLANNNGAAAARALMGSDLNRSDITRIDRAFFETVSMDVRKAVDGHDRRTFGGSTKQ